MRFREGAAYPFLFAEDDPTETTTKARIDLPRVASDADLALFAAFFQYCIAVE